MKYRDRYYMMYNANHTSTEWAIVSWELLEADSPLGFQNGNKYSYPVVGCNQTQLEEKQVDLLRYGRTYERCLLIRRANREAIGQKRPTMTPAGRGGRPAFRPVK